MNDLRDTPFHVDVLTHLGCGLKSCPGKESHRLRPVLSGEKLAEVLKGLSVKAPAANPVIITGAHMLQGKHGSEPAPYHWRGFQRKHSPGSDS